MKDLRQLLKTVLMTQRPSKIDRLKDLYDLSNPVDLFTIIPQEMEIMEVRGLIKGLDGKTKKDAVIKIIMGIAKKSNIALDEETLAVFIDVINAASKGKYALNKEVSK